MADVYGQPNFLCSFTLHSSKMKIKNSCRTFFMEVISSLCFGGVGVPEPELVKLLLDTVFIDSDDKQIYTRNLTPFLKERDSEPVIRTFVLQLLLEHRFGAITFSILIITSKLKNFNKNYKGLGTTEKEKKQEETQTGQ